MSNGPVFILGMQRSGTNQVLNILRSHPDTCWPDGEFHQVFKPRFNARESLGRSLVKLADYSVYYLGSGDGLGPHSPPGARALDGWRAEWVRTRIARRTKANAAEVERVKALLDRAGFYPRGRSGADRVVLKLVDYNVGLARGLSRLYPDAAFVGLLRHPVPVCEGQTARGVTLDKAMASYLYFGRALMDLEAAGARVLTVQFEDLVTSPEAVARKILGHCALDPQALTGFMLQDKRRVTDTAGTVTGMTKETILLPFSEIGQHLRADVNAEAEARFDKGAARAVIDACGGVMGHFGYAVPAEGPRT